MILSARRLLIALLLLAAAVACDDTSDNYLEGSLTDSYDLDFKTVRIRLYTSELSIEYVTGGVQKVALRVSLDVSGGPPTTGVVYDLKAQGGITQGDGFGSPLPELQSGSLEFSKYSGEDGGKVKGRFDALFTTEDGATLSLRGGFSGKLEVVPG